MIAFSRFDQRNYPTLDVREGYGAWAKTYEATVLDLMDIRLAERVETIPWTKVRTAVDLACGTGRAGTWLGGKGVGAIDGVDLTPEMLEQAKARDAYRELILGDVGATGLETAAYDLATQFLADEHLASLQPVYREAARLTNEHGCFLLVGFHPWFLMAGIPTHFDRNPGEPVAIESYVHLFSDHVAAARSAGWRLAELIEGLVDDAWISAKPKWEVHRDRPVSFAMVWDKA